MIRIFTRLMHTLSKNELSKLWKLTSGKKDIDWFAMEREFTGRDALHLKFAHDQILSSGTAKDFEQFEMTPEIESILRERADELKALPREYLEAELAKINQLLTIKMFKDRINAWKNELTAVDMEKIKELHFQAKSVEEISKIIGKPVYVCTRYIARLTNLDSISKSAKILLIRQFKIIGPDYESLSSMLRISPWAAMRNVRKATSAWQTINHADDKVLVRFHRDWSSSELAELQTLVNEYTNKSENIDWNLISTNLKRSANGCMTQYRRHFKDSKAVTKKFTEEEDELLVKHLRVFKDDFKAYPPILPSHKTLSIVRERIKNLINPRGRRYRWFLEKCEKHDIPMDVISNLALALEKKKK